MAIPLGECIGPFHTVVPVYRMYGVLGPLGNARIGKAISIAYCPGINLVPEGFGHLVLVDGKSGEGNIVPGGTGGIVYPVHSGGHGGHFYRHHDRLAGYAALGIGDDHGIIPLIRTGGILQG